MIKDTNTITIKLDAEIKEVVANCDHLKTLKFSPNLPYAFTEHGAVMLASAPNNPVAVDVCIQIVKTFIRFREFLVSNKEFSKKIDELETKYDAQSKIVFDAIRRVMTPLEPKKMKIGF